MGASEQQNFDQIKIEEHCESAYLRYSMAVVTDRALPQVQDGQKPVQRRILYAMSKLGLSASSKPVKSARVVGDVIGKYHPHGDQASYDAMVRMAQYFSLRYPLVHGQGNFGSRDGDSAAAMRYTESRLSNYSEILLSELNKGTVDFVENYDGQDKEPALLPARLPMVLMNGGMGIAVGMATDIPPHNLRETAAAACLILRDPNASLADVLSLMPGPDFPDGGQLISSPEDIAAAYSTGRGSLRMRALWKKEELARGQWQIVFYQLPYQISVRKVLEQLEALTNPQPGGSKKSPTQAQLNLKAMALGLLDKVVDESSHSEQIRLVVSPKTSKINIDELVNFLFANTPLETSVSLNMTMIGLDNKPATKGLLTVLQEWTTFRVATVRRRTQHELAQALARIHILEGRMAVYLNVDEVIRVIRSSDEPRQDLMATFGLDEIQAEDILEMKLRQLARLDQLKIEAEINELKAKAKKLQHLLDNATALRTLTIAEIEADAAHFGDDRRTIIKAVQRVNVAAVNAKPTVDEPVTVIISKNLLVRTKNGTVDHASLTFKTGDSLGQLLESRTSTFLCVMDSLGRVYNVDISNLPSKGDGVPLTSLFELQAGAKILHLWTPLPESQWLLAGKLGFGFIVSQQALATRQKAGKAVLTVEPGDAPLAPMLVSHQELLLVSQDNRVLVMPTQEVKQMDKGKGVTLMGGISAQCTLKFAQFVDSSAKITLHGELKGKALSYTLTGADLSKIKGKRARKGVQAPKKMDVHHSELE